MDLILTMYFNVDEYGTIALLVVFTISGVNH
jgi:hypothetical protein